MAGKPGRNFSSHENIMARIIPVTESGCWLWEGSFDSGGYGEVQHHGKRFKVHRYIYLTLVGPIPDGKQLDHLCRVRSCCNPAHLEAVTARENTMRAIGFPSINAAKTHCCRGHELIGYNVVMQKTGWRNCRICRRLSDAKRRVRAQ